MDKIYKGNKWKINCPCSVPYYKAKQLLVLTGGQELHIGFLSVYIYMYVGCVY
jgi:hypothetical protein